MAQERRKRTAGSATQPDGLVPVIDPADFDRIAYEQQAQFRGRSYDMEES